MRGSFLLLLVLFVVAFVDGARADDDQSDQIDILTEFYDSTNGAEWLGSYRWLSGLPCDPTGNWYGLTCDEFDNVTEIRLNNNGLAGTLSPSLSDLSFLQGLYLNKNKLEGTIPDSFANWESLSSLFLEVNYLNGTIPPFSGENLENLALYANSLSGTIPDSLNQLSWLVKIDLSVNSLTGTIPNLTMNERLESVLLSENNLTGVVPVFPLSVETIQLIDNSLNGTLPDYSQHSDLKNFKVRDNKLKGKIPSWICNAQIVDLSANKFSCGAPDCCFYNLEFDCGDSPKKCQKTILFMPIWVFVVVICLILISIVSLVWKIQRSRKVSNEYLAVN